jgi:DNA-binding response OmpR family regulator
MSKILLLEDDRDMCLLLRTLLEMEGFTVAIYDVNIPPLELTIREKPDVVLLDVHLGGKDGIQILRDFRAAPQFRTMRVVMTSGMNLEEECLTAGADAFLGKPYMPEKLLAILKKAIATPPDQSMQPPETSSAPSTTSTFLAKFL